MNVLQASTCLTPSKALIIHRRDDDVDTAIPPYYVEIHDIEQDGASYKLLAGQPVSRSQLLDLVDVIRTREGVKVRFKSVMPLNVLYERSTKRGAVLIWWIPPGRRILLTRSELKVKAGEASMPGLVFMVVNDQLYCFAVKGNERPSPKTELYRAPFWNVYESGSVCLGTAKIKMKSAEWYEDIIKAYEYMWFHSYFSNVLGTGQAAISLTQLWKSLVGSKKPFPEKMLVIQGKNKGATIQTIIDQIK